MKKYLQSLLSFDYEKDLILKFIDKYTSKQHKILDVGCGYGRFLKPLMQKGYQITGVEKNSTIVKANTKDGLKCYDFEVFDKQDEKYNLIILSHIIEHFSPLDLVSFLDYYLNRLTENGYLLIATPLLSNYFHDDFDHVKPYLPTGILMVYGENNAQVQYYSKHKLKLVDLKFRVSPMALRNFSSMYIKTKYTHMIQAINLAFVGVYLLTCKFVGKRDGWIGVFQKTK
ncbi:class I SAM-dependent methyltransferase [Candidatus Berkiella cookevillensis]|uniref:Bifunctional 3-demethylubiquinone-9 3-methyltransferase/ 2-octaprenyl-6-hydroxy phenol methylase n=1 Tax=Candidatus Berkiella cookevillensis TaxID=437022 RepID=A0A0Q9YRY1_9GAMM|nr:class I SAM-dependent methyltransferase [Candidatus Berkiella cookevillensis]MCS5707697.1 class I SAM-dependent methyltransferase [Candidatus Berkiella cookevillensis]